jgi:hypothetical protein
MLNTIAEALQPGRRSIDRISEDLRALNSDLAAARTAYAEACLDCAEGKPDAEKRKQRAEIERDRIQKRCDELQAALAMAHAREQQKADEAARAEHAARWNTAVRVAEKRHEHISQKLAKSAAAFASDYVEAIRLTEELYVALPAMPDPTAAMLDKTLVEVAVRKELLRRDVDFAFSWPWGKPSLPEFLEPFSGALDVVRSWASRAKETL